MTPETMNGTLYARETLREKLLKLEPKDRVDTMTNFVVSMSGQVPSYEEVVGLVALVLHSSSDSSGFGEEQVQILYGTCREGRSDVITQELLSRGIGILTEEQIAPASITAAGLAKRGVCEELSTETLLNKVLHLCAKEWHDSLPFFGCVVCGDSRHLSTHVVPGYGNVCSDHAPYQQRAVAETWAVEATELHKRGIRRQPAEG